MLIKLHYSGGYSECVDSKFLTSVSITEYINFQFQCDEYSLGCESIEIDFKSNRFLSFKYQATEVLLK